MFHILNEVGQYIDISTLDGVTIAIDYDEALRELDRGVEGLPPETRTNDEVLAGVGKSVVVMRDENDFRTAIAIIAHECAHVEENAYREDHFPGVHFRRPSGQFIRDHQQHFAEAWWGEYAVCRMSAGFAVQEEARFRENLALRLTDCRLKVRDAIRSYRLHADVVRVFNEVGSIILEPLRIASYLIGHLDGLNEKDTLSDIVPEVPTEDSALITAIEQLAEQLRRLWDTRGDWESYDTLVDLGALGFNLLKQFGVHAAPQSDGQAYINVPFTADTFPLGTTQEDTLRAMMGGFKF